MWYHNPLKYVDLEDLESAYAFFLDLLVNRPTEFSAWLAMFMNVYYGVTKRQALALAYEEDALKRDENPARYVAKKMRITISAAYKLLARAHKALEMSNRATETISISIGGYSNEWTPSERQIQRKMSAMKRRCAGGIEGCYGYIPGSFDLCPVCRKEFGELQEQPYWLQEAVRESRRQHRNNARNELYRANVTVEDLEDEELSQC